MKYNILFMKTVKLGMTRIFDPLIKLIICMKNYLKLSYIRFLISRERMFFLPELIFGGYSDNGNSLGINCMELAL